MAKKLENTDIYYFIDICQSRSQNNDKKPIVITYAKVKSEKEFFKNRKYLFCRSIGEAYNRLDFMKKYPDANFEGLK